VHYTVIKHDMHLITKGKCRRVFSNVFSSVLSQSNIRLRLLHLIYDIDFMRKKQQNTLCLCFILSEKHGFLTNESVHKVLSIL